ncbi:MULTISPECIES: hypothetical protein [unclassified Moraxella]|uniref:hypothetical protein n=1 Tax=unclassified Moraxella TaxID=2685852 RepID=UPI003AF8A512
MNAQFSTPIIFLLCLISIAVIAWLTLKLMGGYQRFGSVYHTVRSWIFLLGALLVGFIANNDKIAFGIGLLALLMAVKGQHEICRLFRQSSSQSSSQFANQPASKFGNQPANPNASQNATQNTQQDIPQNVQQKLYIPINLFTLSKIHLTTHSDLKWSLTKKASRLTSFFNNKQIFNIY